MKRRAGRPTKAALIGSLVALVAATFAATPAATAAPPPPDFSADLALNGQAARVAEGLETAMRAQSDFGFLRITSAGIEVGTTGDGAYTRAAGSRLGSTTGAVPVHYVHVSHSGAQLKAVTDELGNTVEEWAAQGVALSSWGPDIDSNTVLVHLATYSSAAAEALTAHFGALVSVAHDSQSSSSSDRTADTAPFYGGDKANYGTSWCTTWFSTRDNTTGQKIMITAGHCGAHTFTSGSGAVLGTVPSSNIHFSGSYDAERSSTAQTNTRLVWSDPHAATRPVTSAPSLVSVGTRVCTDGATDRENCNVTINSLGQTTCYAGQCIGSLAGAHSSSGCAFSGGDSGGPVYSVPSSLSSSIASVAAYGMVVARVTNDCTSGWIEQTAFVLGAFSGHSLSVVIS